MTILFIGSEIEDFVTIGAVTMNSSGASDIRNRGVLWSRGYIECAAANALANYIKAPFAAQSTVWVTARVFPQSIFTANHLLFCLANGSTNRIRLRMSASTTTSTVVLEKFDGSSATTLATSTNTLAGGTLYKMDVYCNYAVSGNIKVYFNQNLYIDYTGDVTTSGVTTLDAAIFSLGSSGAVSDWSEVIVTNSEDTRPLGVKTLAPDAAGDTTAWTSGAYTDIDEVVATDLDIAVSDTAAQVLAVNCTGMPTGVSNLSVRAVKSVVLAARGASGPSKIDIGLRQSSTNGFAASQTLDTGYAAYSATWTTNPITSAAFTPAEITAIQLAYRSAT